MKVQARLEVILAGFLGTRLRAFYHGAIGRVAFDTETAMLTGARQKDVLPQ